MSQPAGQKPPMSRGKKIAIGAAVAVCAPVFIAGMVSGAKDSLKSKSSADSTPSPAAQASAPAVSAKPKPSSPKPSHVTSTDPAIIDAAFAGTVQADDADLQQYSFDQLSQTGRQICSDVRAGTTVHDEAVTLMAVYGAKGAGVLLEVAPDAYCKDLKSSIEKQLQHLS